MSYSTVINHEFGEQMVQYCLIKILNEDNLDN